MDGCDVSQFKTHILAITGEELPKPKQLNKTVMINVLGQNKKYYRNAKTIDKAVQHDYYKNSTRENRKIGHINVTYNETQNITKIIDAIIEE